MAQCIQCKKVLSKEKYTRCLQCHSTRPRSEDWKKKIGDVQRGISRITAGGKNGNWKGGKCLPKKCLKCEKGIHFSGVNTMCVQCANKHIVHKKLMGQKFTEERKKNIGIALAIAHGDPNKFPHKNDPRPEFRGSGNPNWKNGKSPITSIVRSSAIYRKYVRQVLERDYFTCQQCGVNGGELHVNHIRPFAVIIRENNVKSLDEAIKCSALWDIENLETLCVDCHKKTDTYMAGTWHMIKQLNLT